MKTNRYLHRLGASLSLIMCLTYGLCADEPLPVADPPVDAEVAVEQPVAEQAALDARLEKLTAKMQQVSQQLGDKQTGRNTQDLQKSIIQELDDLLKQPPPKPSSNSSGSGGGQSQSGGGKSSKSPSSSANSQQQQGQPSGDTSQSPSQQSGGEMQNRQQADDSEERTGPAREVPVATLPRRRMEVDVWGHLPDKVREQLLNAYSERMVPQYEDLVQRFYRSLADTAEKK